MTKHKCCFCQKQIEKWGEEAYFSLFAPANEGKGFWKTKDYPMHEKCRLEYKKELRARQTK